MMENGNEFLVGRMIILVICVVEVGHIMEQERYGSDVISAVIRRQQGTNAVPLPSCDKLV